jgi:hypothetical protein
MAAPARREEQGRVRGVRADVPRLVGGLRVPALRRREHHRSTETQHAPAEPRRRKRLLGQLGVHLPQARAQRADGRARDAQAVLAVGQHGARRRHALLARRGGAVREARVVDGHLDHAVGGRLRLVSDLGVIGRALGGRLTGNM